MGHVFRLFKIHNSLTPDNGLVHFRKNNNLIKVYFAMKDANHTYLSDSFLHIWSVPRIVAFEVAMLIISDVVIITSVFVLKHIYGKEIKSRAYLLLITASVSDIRVGLLTLPLEGLYVACITFIKCIFSVFYLTYAS